MEYSKFQHNTGLSKHSRHKEFVNIIIPILDNWYFIKTYPDRFVIKTEEYGNITFYPKADTALINNENRLIKHCGLQWIITNLINTQ